MNQKQFNETFEGLIPICIEAISNRVIWAPESALKHIKLSDMLARDCRVNPHIAACMVLLQEAMAIGAALHRDNGVRAKEYLTKLPEQMSAVLLRKGHDYNDTKDRLGNFKDVGRLSGVLPHNAALVLIAVKLTRLKALIGTGRTPMNESLQDNVLDLINYCFLLCAIIHEK